MSDNNRFKPAWTIWNHAKLSLMGEEWKENPGNRPTLKFKVHANNPRFNMYMNDGKVNKPIAFALDPIIFQEFMEVLRRVIANPEPSRYAYELKSSFDHRGQRTEKPAMVSKIFVGRDNDEGVYIALQAKGEALAKFPFHPSYYADLTDASGEKVTKKFGSEVRAIGWMNALNEIVGPYMAVHGKEPEQKPGSGGNNNRKSGDWGKSRSSGGGDDWGDTEDF